jgi:hypothetical protein
MNQNDEIAIEKLVLTRLSYMNATITGIICGLILGLGIFAATNFLILKGGDIIGPNLALLGQFFIGYTVTFPGSLIGLAYGLVTGFLAGYIFARIYNVIATLRENRILKNRGAR